MPQKIIKEEKIKTIPNAKKKLIIMITSVCLMVFSVFQVCFLARYTLGLEVSNSNMAIYNWILKLVSSDET